MTEALANLGRAKVTAFAIGTLVGVGLLAHTSVAREQSPDASCGDGSGPWIRFEEPPPAQRLLGFPKIVRHVRAELKLRGIDVCFDGRGAPIGVVQILATANDSVEVVVDVHDAVTHKRVSRTLDLRAIPADARPLAIAVGTDELLLASWMEVAVEKPAAHAEPPEQVVRAVSAELRSDLRVELGAAGTYDAFGAGVDLFGIDIRGRWFLSDRLAATVRLGLRQGREADAPSGTVQTSAWLFGVGARLAATSPVAPFGADLFGRVDALRVSFVPDAGEEAVGHPRAGLAVVGAVGMAGRFRPSSTLRFGVEGSVGTPLRPIHATDTGARVASLAGLVVSGGGEVALLF